MLEEVSVLIDTHFFNEFTETKSSAFLKNVIANQNTIDLNLFKRTWRSLNWTPKTMKVVREIQENLICIGKSRDDHKEDGDQVLVQQGWASSQREARR